MEQKNPYPNGMHNPPPGYMPQQQDPVRVFQYKLSNITSADGRRIEELTEFARIHHDQLALELTEVLFERIRNSMNRLTFMFIMDSILKNVQGNYIRLIEERITPIFLDHFSKADINEKRSLIKMFKTWDLFFQRELLDSIATRLDIHELSRRLLNEQEEKKVDRFRRSFEPQFLPDSVLRSGLFTCGSDVNIADVERNYEARRFGQPNQFQNQPPSGAPLVGVPQAMGKPAGEAMMGMPANYQQHQQMSGQSNFYPSGQIRGNTPNQFPQTQQNTSSMDLLRQIAQMSGVNSVPQQQVNRTKLKLLQNPLPQIVVQQQNQSQPHSHQRTSYPISANPLPYQGQGLTSGMHVTGQAYHGTSSRNLGQNHYMNQYENGYNDDNFAQQQQTIDHLQIGFLPSILKSFYKFKESQTSLLGQDPRLQSVKLSGKAMMPPNFGDLSTIKEFNLLAIAEVYESIKLQCSICGMRFVRNLTLKKHLDMHFQKNNEFRKRGKHAAYRPLFLTAKDFIQPKSQFGNQKGNKGKNTFILICIGGMGGQGGQLNIEDMAFCMICKEKFEVLFNEEEEQWFLVGAKQIRTVNNKSVQTVHSVCLGIIEMSKDLHSQLKNQKEQEQQQEPQIPQIKEDKQPELEKEGEEIQQENIQMENGADDLTKREKKIPLEELEKQIRGIVQIKKQFLLKQ